MSNKQMFYVIWLYQLGMVRTGWAGFDNLKAAERLRDSMLGKQNVEMVKILNGASE